VAESCGAGLTCYDGITKPHCGAPGEVACDPASFVNTCSPDGGSIVSCYDGFTYHASCSPCMDEHGVMGPCRCSTEVTVDGFEWTAESVSCEEATQLTCVPISEGACDPATDADVCNGNVAHRCVNHWEDVDCAASGLVCDVGQGRAGCREANAAACNTTTQQCDGTEIVACCMCGSGWFHPALPEPPCVPGFEVRGDCLGLGQYYTCAPSGGPFGSATCVFQP
jgi:hypothetical protein